MGNISTHSAFEHIRSDKIDTLHIDFDEYRHKKTGARHYHLTADNDENVFLVALHTVPTDSTGVAHMLEHTVLCGSEHYPVRDPFFMMIRRSLNTFMNAFTSSDWTAYPFASKNKKDFHNLLQVYLDAVFFSNLNELDFLQEGHRFEFEKMDDPNSPLVYKGVVYNEMKGAMSSPVSRLWQSLSSHLFPTVTYHYNSGGEPRNIPDLSYQELVRFYRKHYHPSNSVFLTYGDIPAEDHHARFEDLALARFEKLDHDIHVDLEKRYSAPLRCKETYPVGGEEETKGKTHIVMGWLLKPSTSIEDVLRAHILSGVLLDNSASPLRRALETTELGSAPSPLCGLEDSMKEMVFCCGLEGSEPQHADAVEKLVLSVLQDVADNGVPQEMVEAVLHQLELSQREIGGDGYPFGLQIMLNALGPAIHGADPVAYLSIDTVLQSLRKKIEDPRFIRDLAREFLLDNPHRVHLVMEPDPQYSEKEASEEKARLAEVASRLNGDEQKKIIELATRLKERQQQEDDPECLPKVGIEDIPATMKIPDGETVSVGKSRLNWYDAETNGLGYAQCLMPLPELTDEERALLPILTDMLGELGAGKESYLDLQHKQSRYTGGIGSYMQYRTLVENNQDGRGVFVLSGKALDRNTEHLADIMHQILNETRFDESDRMRELISQSRLDAEQSITGKGHALAMIAASSGFLPATDLTNQWKGLRSVQSLKELDQRSKDSGNLKSTASIFESIMEKIRSMPTEFLVVAENKQLDTWKNIIANHWQGAPDSGDITSWNVPFFQKNIRQAWLTSTAVNFCSKSYLAVPASHEDGAKLSVLAELLRNNFLHGAIREQGGAYGGGASYDTDSGCFRFYSYRDPRLTETLDDFDRSLEWFLEKDHEWRLLEEAILGVIGHMDKPGSPAGEAKRAFHNKLHGRDKTFRQQYRQRVLETDISQLKTIVEKYLVPEKAGIAVVTNSTNASGLPADFEKITL